jgi:uncharacterized Fe-S cluster-containing radical SAM superfamily enzyme
LVVLEDPLGVVTRGVRVGSAAGVFAAGVLTVGVIARGRFVAGRGVSVTNADCVFCAWTVSATEVAMIELFEAPQEVKVRVKMIIVVKNGFSLNFICFLSFTK